MPVDFNFMVGGEAGQGVQSVGFLLAKVFARGGYHVFADQDYESRIRGGHNFFRVRVSDAKIGAITEEVDILIALNRDSIELHQDELTDGGMVIFDGEKIKDIDYNGSLLSVPLENLAEGKASGKLMTNTVALGAALALVNYDLEILNRVLVEHFGEGKVADSNIAAARAGYEYARTEYKGNVRRLKAISDAKRMLLTGNETISLGAIAAGCKFMSAYPMTPASSIMEYIAAKAEDFGMVMVHAEDEIAAVNMAIGAGYAGVRAMTATSGSGFCLMVEGLGLAGITETPVVIIDAQRPGPAVGLPTRTEQGDLQFVLHAHHGDFPRVVLAPATIEDAFWVTARAFNWAEKYQLPVMILTDHHLASSYASVDPLDLSQVSIDRGLLFSGDENEALEYRRHRITPSGISPRAFPGLSKALVELEIETHRVLLVSGIGEAGKLPHYTLGNVFNSLHGRPLSPAAGAKIANPDLVVIAISGDGDGYGEGGNHFIHAARRNHDITYLVHNNQVYGLTKGQASPTSDAGFVTKTTPYGAANPVNPISLAIVSGASFVARGFAGDTDHLSGLMKKGVAHRGFSLIDVLQPCVSFNHKNTFQWYRDRVYKLDNERSYDSGDKRIALAKALEWGEKIPIGVIYEEDLPVYEDQLPALHGGPLVTQKIDPKRAEKLFTEFM